MKLRLSMLLTLLLVGAVVATLDVRTARGDGFIYIRADGSIEPSTAPISTVDHVTYTFTSNITSNSIVVERDNIVLDGASFTLRGSGSAYGIKLYSRHNVTVENTNVQGFQENLYLYSSFGNNLSGNNVTDSIWDGIWLYDSSNNTVINNKVTNNSDYGIFLSSSSGNTVSGNDVTNNDRGITLYSSCDNNTVSGNNVANNTWEGIRLQLYCDGNTVSGNVASNTGEGIVLSRSCGNNTVSGNNIANNEIGIDLWTSSGNTVSGNNLTNGRCGITLTFASGNMIYGNSFVGNVGQVMGAYTSVNAWDNGYPSGGNYWSDYTGMDLYSGPYQNETGYDGIGDATYVIDVSTADNYPLMDPYEVRPPVQILVLSPQNQTYAGRSIPLNFTVYGSWPISWMCYCLNEQTNITVTGSIVLNVGQGSHSVVVYANDTYGNIGSSGIVCFSSLGGCVVIRCQYLDGCPRSGASVCKISPPPGIGIGTTNESGYVQQCGVLEPGSYLVQATYNGSQFGYNIGISVDMNGDGSATITNWNLEITPPVLQVLSPQNKTYYGSSVPLNYSIYDYSTICWTGYSLDGQANVTITGNASVSGLSDGSHSIIVYSNDTFGNMGYSNTVYFTVGTTIHDVAVTNVTLSKSIVGQGYSMGTNVTVENRGDDTETFNVTVYANTTAIQTETLTLTSGNSTTLTFIWNTSGFARGNYTMSAVADAVPGETDFDDNTLIDGEVTISKLGDLNLDGAVNYKDAALFRQAYIGEYNYLADFNQDEVINYKDASLFRTYYITG